MSAWMKRYWFNAGLVLVVASTLPIGSGWIAETGRWLYRHGGPEATIISIFLLSGSMVRFSSLCEGVQDGPVVGMTGLLIFLISPAAALLIAALPLPVGLRIGLFLVAVMPTTLSSGVVMTGAAGGQMAGALMITVGANILAVVTIPVALGFLMASAGLPHAVELDRMAVMGQVALLAIAPLLLGMLMQGYWSRIRRISKEIRNGWNQLMVLAIVWMALSQAAGAIQGRGGALFLAGMLSLIFHGCLLAAAFLSCGYFRIGPGRREIVIFMGCQKTLPLSVILQASFFPEHPSALLFCVVHHFLHLFWDGYLVQRMRR